MTAEETSTPESLNNEDAPAPRNPFASPVSPFAQLGWAATPIGHRLGILTRARHRLAREAEELAAAMPSDLSRTIADSLVAEVLPLLEACRFLERRAAAILAPRHLGRHGRPFWLAGVASTIERVPFGHILVIGPANYPLLLPGVQVMQALAAGNAVTLKPGRGGAPVAHLLAQALYTAGLPRDLLLVTEDTVAAAEHALDQHPAKIVFTGSAATGRLILRRLAETASPSVMELSGCDAVFVLPSADLARTARALAFGLRLNGSSTCMAPRRLFVVGLSPAQRKNLFALLQQHLSAVPAVMVPALVRNQLKSLLKQAVAHGAEIVGDSNAPSLAPLLVLHGTPDMAIAQADIFAPVLTVIEVATEAQAIKDHAISSLSLTAAVFGGTREARQLASRIDAGTVLVNDLIVPTADPRVPFGGRGASGFGVTRGTEGLLEMTQPRVIAVRGNTSTRHYDATDDRHAELFGGLIAAAHGGSWRGRLAGLRRALTAAGRLRT